MPTSPIRLTTNPQRTAFLAMLGVSEGTTTSKATRNDGFDVIVTGVDGVPEVFTDYSHHPFSLGRPSKVINHVGLTSNAAGRYQIMLKWWNAYRSILMLPDFTPASQDQYALNQCRERGALGAIDAGRFEGAVNLLTGLWASLPGKYYAGQHQNSMEYLQSVFVAHGGVLSPIP